MYFIEFRSFIFSPGQKCSDYVKNGSLKRMVTRNLSLNRYEKRNAKKRGGEAELALEELSECTAGSVSVDGELMKHELEKAVNVFLDGLPERERSIFLRRYFRFESNAEIAERFGISANNLTVALSRTRKKLRKHLEKEGYFK